MSKISFGPHKTRSGYDFTVTEKSNGVFEIEFLKEEYKKDKLTWYDNKDVKGNENSMYTFWQLEALLHLHQMMSMA